MKKFATALVAVSLIAAAVPAMARPVCLDTYRIKTTKAPDAHHIIFTMIDGSKWSNQLKNSCPGLLFNGFSYEPTAGRDVCENLQTVRVLDDGAVCLLGKFTQVAPART